MAVLARDWLVPTTTIFSRYCCSFILAPSCSFAFSWKDFENDPAGTLTLKSVCN